MQISVLWNIKTVVSNKCGVDDALLSCLEALNRLRPRQNGRHIADDTFKRIFVSENFRILIKISRRFVPKGSINNIPALVQIMAWRRPDDKPLFEPMMVSSLTHIFVTRPQWVKFKFMGLTIYDSCYDITRITGCDPHVKCDATLTLP